MGLPIRGFDLRPTGNEYIDSLRILEARAQTMIAPEERKEFYKDEIESFEVEDIRDSHFVVRACRTVAFLSRDNKYYIYENETFVGRPLKLQCLRIGQEDELLTIAYDDLKPLADSDTMGANELSFRVPVLDIEYCIPYN